MITRYLFWFQTTYQLQGRNKGQGIVPVKNYPTSVCIRVWQRISSKYPIRFPFVFHWPWVIVVVQSLNHVWLFVIPWTAAHQVSLSFLHHLPESAQIHVHWVDDAIQPSHPLSCPSPVLSLSQHQGLFQWVSSSHQSTGTSASASILWLKCWILEREKRWIGKWLSRISSV